MSCHGVALDLAGGKSVLLRNVFSLVYVQCVNVQIAALTVVVRLSFTANVTFVNCTFINIYWAPWPHSGLQQQFHLSENKYVCQQYWIPRRCHGISTRVNCLSKTTHTSRSRVPCSACTSTSALIPSCVDCIEPSHFLQSPHVFLCLT